MNASPSPVVDEAPDLLSAYPPQPVTPHQTINTSIIISKVAVLIVYWWRAQWYWLGRRSLAGGFYLIYT